MAKYARIAEPQNFNPAGKTEEKRQEFFSKVPCSDLKWLYRYYYMDFKLFDYDPKPFFKLCKK